MRNSEFATGVLIAVLLLAGCDSDRDKGDVAFSQQRAISSDMDASFQHGPSVTDHALGVEFNDNLDASINNRPPPLGAALGFR